MSALLRLLLPALLALPMAARAEPVQYVLISFDGAKDISQWERSRALARETGASFTYFLSCAFLLPPETRSAYRQPGAAPSHSNVGFAASREDVAARLRQIWAARREGHEVASHGCGHFDGKGWSAEAWGHEFSEFSRILADAWRINGLKYEPDGWREFAKSGVTGFRAPYLSTSPGLEAALKSAGFAYDASAVSRDPETPAAKAGITRFALPMIAEGPDNRRILAMDYNLFVRHSGGFERRDSGGTFEARAYKAFSEAFAAQYSGKRQPLQIGLHFTLMNDGAYWRALERFAREACGKPDVRCTGYDRYLGETGRTARGPS